MFKNSAQVSSNILLQPRGRILFAWTASLVTTLMLFFAASQAHAQITINAVFTPDFVPEGESSTLTLTIANPSSSLSVTNIASNIALPLLNFRLVDTPPTINTCPTTVNTNVASAITLTGKNTPALPPSILGINSCVIAVTVVALRSATNDGTFTVPANALLALQGMSRNFPAQQENAGAKIGPPLPIMTAAVNPASVLINAPATLTYTLVNPDNVAKPISRGTITFPIGISGSAPASTCGSTFTLFALAFQFGYDFVGGSIPPNNGICTISFTIQSSTPGAYTSFVAPNDLLANGGNTSRSTATLTVTAPAPAITLTTSPVIFGPQTINTTSPAQVVTLTNGGTANLTLNVPTSTGPFAFITNCTFLTPPVPAGGSCTFTVTFTPIVIGAATGTIDFSSNAPSSPTSIPLSGIGSAVAVPGVVITPVPPTPLTFAPQTVATTSDAQTILVANTGAAVLLIGSIAITTGATDFARVPTLSDSLPPDCVAILPANQQCSISITFTPRAVGSSTGNVQVVTNATPRIYNVPLVGSGLGTTVGLLSVSDAINFGDQIIGTSSTAQTVFISNVGNGFVFVNSVGVAGPNAADFQSAGICGGLVPGASCAVSVSFNPATIGPKTAQLAIGSDAQNAATVNAIGLSGNGVPLPRPLATLSATAVGFGNTIFGGAAAPQNVTLTNNGTLPLLIQSTTTSAEYAQANNCPASLNPQASCTISLSFTPLGLGPRAGEFVLNSNTADSPNRVLLGGNGCRWFKPPGSRLFANICRN